MLHEYPKLDLAPGAGPLHLHSLGIHLLDETTRQGSRLRHSLAKVVTNQQVGWFSSSAIYITELNPKAAAPHVQL